MADDIRIVAHSKYDKYPTGYSEEELSSRAAYVLKDHQYFLDHTDYDATASSTLAAHASEEQNRTFCSSPARLADKDDPASVG